MRTPTAIEDSILISIVRWCSVALMVTAFTVIVVDMTVIYLNVNAAEAMSDNGEASLNGLFRPSGSTPLNGMVVGESESTLRQYSMISGRLS